jgi:aryl-phospho-beta-D-glucosidase BglC (GH1 family)
VSPTPIGLGYAPRLNVRFPIFIKVRGVNLSGTSIRLPIGYFTLGPNFCVNTPFAPYSQVYVNAWATIKAFVARARSCGIGVLIDFHALPGGANTGEHSGTNSGKADLWGNRANLDLSEQCIEFMAKEIGTMDGVIGLQIVNEAPWDPPGLFQFYDRAIAGIANIDTTIPIYVSDGWNATQCIDYIKSKNSVTLGSTSLSNPVIIDNHVYYCFSDTDQANSPQQIIDRVPTIMKELDGKDGSVINSGAAQVVIGEWSCVLSDKTWAKLGTEDRNQMTQKFGQAQCARFNQRTAGNYFWTFKMDWMDGGDWGFVQQTNTGSVCPPSNLTLSSAAVSAAIAKASSQQQGQQQASYDGHVNYWARRGSGYEHWRYSNGWTVGWNDALAFFGMRLNGFLPGTGGDKIGCVEIWARKRISESSMVGNFVWEFETGLRQGIADFYSCAGI